MFRDRGLFFFIGFYLNDNEKEIKCGIKGYDFLFKFGLLYYNIFIKFYVVVKLN